jgi:hypothetical protein
VCAPAAELASFPTSLEEDEALLASRSLGVRLEAAVLFRRERKQLIKAATDAMALYAAASARVAAKAAAKWCVCCVLHASACACLT